MRRYALHAKPWKCESALFCFVIAHLLKLFFEYLAVIVIFLPQNP